MHFFTLALVACATFVFTIADVSHLVNDYITPKSMMPQSPVGNISTNYSKESRIITTIEKQELRKLPTQIEYLKPGEMAYGFEIEAEKRQNEMFPKHHDGLKSLKMMMPRELLSPSTPSTPSQEEEPPPTVKLHIRYLAKNEMFEELSMDTPAKQYLAPKPKPNDEEELQEQSAPAPQYLLPQRYIQKISTKQNKLSQINNVKMRQQIQKENSQTYLSPKNLAPQTDIKYNLSPKKMTIELKMQSTRDNLNPFGEVENVAEAAQEAIEMFDEQLVDKQMSLSTRKENANFYNSLS